MISVSDYMGHDAVALAALVQRREVSALELLEAAIARFEAVNPRIGAVVIPMIDLARERAGTPLDGPFAGVPFLVKDLFQDYAGVLATSGCAAWKRAMVTPVEHFRNRPSLAGRRRCGLRSNEYTGVRRQGHHGAGCLGAYAQSMEISSTRPVGPAAAQQRPWLRGSSRSQERATGAARSAFRPRPRVCSG